MKIWLINHYAVPPQYYPLARPSLFAKNLIKMGHEVTIIAASTIHNSESKNLITDNKKVQSIEDDGIPYVLINCTAYKGNGINRVRNIWEFARRLPKVLYTLEQPDAIVATSFDPLSCYAGIKYAKKHGIKAVAEIADLWPETLVAYNGVSPQNPIVKYLRSVEKKIYTQSDAIVFTMEGAYDYIIEQGWEKEIPISKVFYINNGIDLEQFDYNREHYQIEDEDLLAEDTYKIVYAGAIRKVNNIDKLLEIAKKIENPKIRFLVWGDGDELERIKQRVQSEQITNTILKGRVAKKYIPYITSNANLNFAHNDSSALFKYGISFNKIFDYMAAGKPILCDFPCKYNPVIMNQCGFSVESPDPRDIAAKIEDLVGMSYDEYQRICQLSLDAAQKYDFKCLTGRLLSIIEQIRR